MGETEVVRNALEKLLSRRTGSGAGMQYGGRRDVYEVAGYPRSIRYREYSAMYDRDGVAAEIVDMPVEVSWRRTPEVKGSAGFDAVWSEMVDRLNVFARLEALDKAARIGRYAVMVIGTRGSDSPETPLESLSPDDVVYLSPPYPEGNADIVQWETDEKNPRYGMPTMYQLSHGSADGFSAPTRRVHWSRCIHVAEGTILGEVYGIPALQRVYNDLVDLQKLTASTPEAYWQEVAGLLMAEVTASPDSVGLSDDEVKALEQTLGDIYHDLRRVFIGQNVKLERLHGGEKDPGPASLLCFRRISAGSEIPMRMLFGSETGERSSTEDQKSFLGRMEERRSKHCEARILRPLIDRLQSVRGLPAGKYEIVWEALFTASETEIAEANLARARAAAALDPMNPLGLVEIDETRNIWLRPTGERGDLTPEELEPKEPEIPDVGAPIDEGPDGAQP